MDAYIAKPLRAKQLLAIVDAVALSAIDESEVRLETEQAECEPPSLDLSAALSRLQGDRELLLEQITFYLEDSPLLIRDVEGAIENADAQKLQMAAHRMRGLAAGFDVEPVVQSSAKLEEMGGTGEMTEASEEVQRLRKAWEISCHALRSYSEQEQASTTP
jgi:HPt (histidine-containing phosphotransfer) domain-containing protein